MQRSKSSVLVSVNLRQQFILCCCILVSLLFSLHIMAVDANQLFSSANKAYKATQYEKAIEGYSQVRAKGVANAALYYNLGNAHYKLGHISQAILNYERALKLQPTDEDAQHNLRLMNTKIVDRVLRVPQLAIVSGWQNFVHGRSAKGWSLVAVALVWVALLFFAAYLFVPSVRRLGFFAGIVFMLAALFTTYLAFSQNHYEKNSGEAILMAANTYVKSAPDAGSTDIFMIHEGLKLEVLDQVGEWAKIRLADGKVGWINRNAMERI